MFDLSEKSCTLAHLNVRDEKHGEENVMAIDMKFSGDFDGDILAEFGPELRHSLYKKSDGGDLADQGMTTPTALRFPTLIQPLKFENAIVGAEVNLSYGIGEVTLDTCDVNNFRVECHEGGTVTVTFRIQAKPTGDQLAKIATMLSSDVEVTIIPPQSAANDGQQVIGEVA